MAKLTLKDFEHLVARKDIDPAVKAVGAECLYGCWKAANIEGARPKEEIFVMGLRMGLELAIGLKTEKG